MRRSGNNLCWDSQHVIIEIINYLPISMPDKMTGLGTQQEQAGYYEAGLNKFWNDWREGVLQMHQKFIAKLKNEYGALTPKEVKEKLELHRKLADQNREEAKKPDADSHDRQRCLDLASMHDQIIANIEQQLEKH